MKNQTPQPLGGRRARPTPPAPADATSPPTSPPTAPAPAEQPAQVMPSSPPTSPPTNSPTSPPTAPAEVGPLLKKMPRMAVFFFMPEDYELFEQAADLDGLDVADWIQDALCELAEARVRFDEKVQSSVDAFSDDREEEEEEGE